MRNKRGTRYGERKRQVSTLAALLFFGLSASAHAALFQVDSKLDVVDAMPGDGLCATATNTCTLRAAIQEANASPGFDEVRLPPDSYLLNLRGGVVDDTAVSGDLDILEPLWLRADPQFPVIAFGVQISDDGFVLHSADGERVFDINTGNSSVPVRFENVLIGFGKAHDALGGGAVLVHSGSSVLFERSVLYANGADARGNAMAVYGVAQMRQSRVFDNHRSWNSRPGEGGGAFYVADGASLKLVDVTVDGNNHCSGGAILALGDAVLTIVRSNIGGNSADNLGGCISSQQLGGEFALAGAVSLRIEDSTLNPVVSLLDARGGAQIELSHVTVAPDSVRSEMALHDASTHLAIGNSVWARNTGASTCSAPVGGVVSLGGNIFLQSPVCQLALASNDVTVSALQLEEVILAAADDGTQMFARTVFAPKRGSPLIDNGLTALCSQQDEASIARPIAGSALSPARCDSGAIEWPPTSLRLDGFE
jgi:hypothetical protein